MEGPLRGWRRFGIAGLVVLLVPVTAVLWLGSDRPATPKLSAAQPAAGASAAEPAEDTYGTAWALASLASKQADAAQRALVLDAAELQRLDEADCQRMAPAFARLKAGQLPDGPDFEWDAGDEHHAWQQRWIHALKQRGDERSLAAADFLESQFSAEDLARFGAAVQRLHQRALRSGDGFVLALANQRHCDPTLGCKQAVPRDRWLQLEPYNLSAWLAAPPANGQPVPDTWLNGLMQSTHDNSYRGELMSLLRSLPPQLPAGPRRLSRDIGLIGINAAFAVSSIRSLNQHCAGGSDADRCRALAEKLWTLRESNLMNWMQNLSLVRHSPPMSAVWEARAQQVEAAFQWSSEEAAGMIIEPMIHSYQCKENPVFERWTYTSLTRGEGVAMLTEIKARGLDVSRLSAQYRQRNGSSLLQAARK